MHAYIYHLFIYSHLRPYNHCGLYVCLSQVFDAVKTRHPATESVLFPDMAHGWVPRADIKTNPDAARDVNLALTLMADYFSKHL